MKNILFLDIDGVMLPFYKNGGIFSLFDSTLEKFPVNCVKALNRVIKETNCDIVISSDWRHHYDLKQLCAIFELNGIETYPIDITGYVKGTLQNLEESRIQEIYNWLSNNTTDKWCALDDMKLTGLGDEHFVLCKRPSKEGISQCGVIDKVIKRLKYEK
jgi:hypothetical protein